MCLTVPTANFQNGAKYNESQVLGEQSNGMVILLMFHLAVNVYVVHVCNMLRTCMAAQRSSRHCANSMVALLMSYIFGAVNGMPTGGHDIVLLWSPSTWLNMGAPLKENR